jgi:REP element-mobilizing transposase RayT
VFSLKYHLVWCPKYRKRILVDKLAKRLRQLLYQIGSIGAVSKATVKRYIANQKPRAENIQISVIHDTPPK